MILMVTTTMASMKKKMAYFLHEREIEIGLPDSGWGICLRHELAVPRPGSPYFCAACPLPPSCLTCSSFWPSFSMLQSRYRRFSPISELS